MWPVLRRDVLALAAWWLTWPAIAYFPVGHLRPHRQLCHIHDLRTEKSVPVESRPGACRLFSTSCVSPKLIYNLDQGPQSICYIALWSLFLITNFDLPFFMFMRRSDASGLSFTHQSSGWNNSLWEMTPPLSLVEKDVGKGKDASGGHVVAGYSWSFPTQMVYCKWYTYGCPHRLKGYIAQGEESCFGPLWSHLHAARHKIFC